LYLLGRVRGGHSEPFPGACIPEVRFASIRGTTPRPKSRLGGLHDRPSYFCPLLPTRRRTIVYVDGFNLFYGALKGTPYKWLDLDGLFRRLRPHDDIKLIRYFTALVEIGPHRLRQYAYLEALASFPNIKVLLGKFKMKQVTCTFPDCTVIGDRVFSVPEEKRTDVNIAVHMVDDAYRNECDQFVLVSGDSDLVPPIRLIRTAFPEKRVVVYVPANDCARGYAVELRTSAHKHATLPAQLLPFSQLPRSLPNGSGGTISKPLDW